MKSIKDKIFSIKDDKTTFKKILTICGLKFKFHSYKYRFNNDNSIIYDNNQDLGKSMEQAILLNKDDYKIMQENLNKVAKNLYNDSLQNLKDILISL